jgi:hypothetical protein
MRFSSTFRVVVFPKLIVEIRLGPGVKPNSVFVMMSFVGLLVSFWNRNDLPGSIDYVPHIMEEPIQEATQKKPFKSEYKDIIYDIDPEFEYDLTGMIVSYRHHDGGSRMHMRSNDHLNMLDVCVVWGDNTANSRLDQIDFWNGIFTCNFFTRDEDAWDAFDIYQVSNNHLISDDEFIRDQVKDINIGDQIRVRGFLASYGREGMPKRGTSTTRLDTGDGACETLFVEKFEIVQAATNYWRVSMFAALAMLVIGLFNHFRRPFRPFNNR